MRYAEFHPRDALRPFLRCYWELTGFAGPPDTILPDGRTELVFHFGDAFIENGSRQPRAMFVGQMSRSTTIQATGKVGCFGVRFESAGFWALFGDRPIDYLGGQGFRGAADADPNYQLLAIGADAALTYFRWVLARRIEAEGNGAAAAALPAVARAWPLIELGPAPDLA